MLKDFVELFKAYAEVKNLPDWIVNDIALILLSISFFFSLIGFLFKGVRYLLLKRTQKALNEELAPFYTIEDVDKATRYYIPTKYQMIAPYEEEDIGISTYLINPKGKLIPKLLKGGFHRKKHSSRYILILADSGMGKTTFMINLFLAYKRRYGWMNSKFNIKLIPLGSPHATNVLGTIHPQRKKDMIMLLDAFDEDTKALIDYNARMEEIMKLSWEFKQVIITCRTQFFPSTKEIPHETGNLKFGVDAGEYKFQKIYISPFSEIDIMFYLVKKYFVLNPLNWNKFIKAYKIVKKSPSLMARPMLLSRMDDLISSESVFKYSYLIYEELIKKWIEREADKPGIKEVYKSKEIFKNLLLRFSEEIALNMYEHQRERNGLYINKDHSLLSDNEFLLESVEGRNLRSTEKRSKSLLNRDAEGNYKFSHKSILEYFLAREATRNDAFLRRLNFSGFTVIKKFLNEIILNEKLFPLLNECEGTYTIESKKESSPLIDLSPKEILKVEELILKKVKPEIIPFFIVFRKLNYLILVEDNFLDLYYIYSKIYWKDYKELILNRYFPEDSKEIRTLFDYGRSELKDVQNLKDNICKHGFPLFNERITELIDGRIRDLWNIISSIEEIVLVQNIKKTNKKIEELEKLTSNRNSIHEKMLVLDTQILALKSAFEKIERNLEESIFRLYLSSGKSIKEIKNLLSSPQELAYSARNKNYTKEFIDEILPLRNKHQQMEKTENELKELRAKVTLIEENEQLINSDSINKKRNLIQGIIDICNHDQKIWGDFKNKCLQLAVQVKKDNIFFRIEEYYEAVKKFEAEHEKECVIIY